MSVLEIPRIMFRGEVSWDPIVTNNTPAWYDEANASTVFPSVRRTVADFRAAAIQDVESGGNWNVHGTHRAKLFNTSVVSVDTGAGPKEDDPFVQAPVSLIGMLVDCEPYGTFSSQIFFDEMSFGIPGGCRIRAPRSFRTTARYINFSRNPANAYIAGLASVVWQTSFAKADGLSVDAFDSPALQALETALQLPGVLGLTVRWNSYRTVYFDNLNFKTNSDRAKQLANSLRDGGFQPNPARSLVVGVLGLWREGEPHSEPGDRTVVATGKSRQVASAFARVAADTLTLDFSNTISEITQDCEKAKLGTFSLAVVAADGSVTSLGALSETQYAKAAYEAAAGIITLPLTIAQAAAAEAGDLQMSNAGGDVLLQETALRALPLTPNLYLDAGSTAQVQVQVLDRGAPAAAGIEVTLAAAGAVTPVTQTVRTDANGLAAFDFSGQQGQVQGFYLLAGPSPNDPGGIDTQRTTYFYVRTLGDIVDYTTFAATWDNVYSYVLSNWHALAPCMDNWLDFSDPNQLLARAALIKQLTDPKNFESFLFMPVTRDMTAGKRDLLYRFLDGATPAAAATSAIGTATKEDVTSLAAQTRLSRAMRGN